MDTKDYTLECKEKSEDAINTPSTEFNTPGSFSKPESTDTVTINSNSMCNSECLDSGNLICIFLLFKFINRWLSIIIPYLE